MSVYLKVKILSLAEEARIIKRMERKFTRRTQGDGTRLPTDPRAFGTVNGLSQHRKLIVRTEQRHTLIAYGYLRGRTFAQIEGNAKTRVDWVRVEKMVSKYGPWYNSDRKAEFVGWSKQADALIAENNKVPAAV